LYDETILKIINKGKYKNNIDLLYLLIEAKSTLSSEVISEVLGIEQIKAEEAINTCKELLFEKSLTPKIDDFLLFNETLRKYIQRKYSKECKEMQNKIVEFCFNYKEIKGEQSLEYALIYGVEQLYDIKDHNRIWDLLKNTDYIEMQIQKFKHYNHTFKALKKAIQIYIEREGETSIDDGRLCWLMLKTGKISEQAELNVNVKEVIGWMKEKAIDDPNRVSNILNKIESFSDVDYFKHIVYILWIDAYKQKELSKEVRNPEFAEKILEALDKKIPKGSESVCWSDFFPYFIPWIVNFLFDVFPDLKLFNFVRRSHSNGLCNFCYFLITINNNERNISFATKVANSIENSSRKSEALSSIAKFLAKNEEIEKAVEVTNSVKGINVKSEVQCIKAKSLAKSGKIERALEVSNTIKDSHKKSEALRNIVESLSEERDFDIFKEFLDLASLNSEDLFSTILEWRLSLVEFSKKLYLRESFVMNIDNKDLNYHAVLSLLHIYIKDGNHEYINSIIEHCPGLDLDFLRKEIKSGNFVSKDYNPFDGFMKAKGIFINKDITEL